MTLRKDIQLVAYLIQKRIAFEAFIHTVHINENNIDADTLFKLREYETEKEKPQRIHVKKYLTEAERQKINTKYLKNDFRHVLEHIGLEVINYEDYKRMCRKEILPPVSVKKKIVLRNPPIDIKRIISIAEKIDKKHEPIARPKAEYSNKQWKDYYKD